MEDTTALVPVRKLTAQGKVVGTAGRYASGLLVAVSSTSGLQTLTAQCSDPINGYIAVINDVSVLTASTLSQLSQCGKVVGVLVPAPVAANASIATQLELSRVRFDKPFVAV